MLELTHTLGVGQMAQTSQLEPPTFSAQMKPVDTALIGLHYVYPAVIFGYFAVSSGVSICTLSDKKEHPRRRTLVVLMLFSVLSYLGQIAAILIPSIICREWLGQQDAMISLLSCILVFGLQLAMLSDEQEACWYPFIGPYLLALVFEPALEIVTLSARTAGPLSWPEIAQLSIISSRYLAIGLTVATYFTWRNVPSVDDATDAEQQPLIPKNADGTPTDPEHAEGAQSAPNYSSTSTTVANSPATSSTEGSDSSDSDSGDSDASDSSKANKTKKGKKNKKSKNASKDTNSNANELPWERQDRRRREDMEKRLKENGNWFDYAKRFLIFFPYIWPVDNRPLQIRAVLVGVCLLANNALNVLIPRQLGVIMDSLSHANDKNPWVQVIIFAGLKFAASQAGISLLRQWLWIPVEYYSFGAMSIAAYSHVLNLSSDFHDSKSSSDIMVAINSGQNIANLLESLCFSALPMVIDLMIAFVYLSATFGPYEGFITFATAVIFLYIAGRMISGLKTARRSEVKAWFEEHFVRQAGIQGWATVASFNQVSHEEERYSTAVKDRTEKSQYVFVGYLFAYAFQYLVLLAGLLAGAFLAVWQVTSGQSTPGQFVMLLTYWTQLVAPLTFFAGLGKSISRNFIHAEQLLEIMNTKATVVNKENAEPLVFSGGSVEFENVTFSYNDKKNILRDVSFEVGPGTTVAFVGATGAGKSTVLKLLDRFYDVTEGAIKIDGQDIRDVDIRSLRSRIGIVPQAPILFNDTIMNNVRYAKLDASDQEVYDACRAAAIHEQILGFSDGYDSRVGERGIKLSGGELQRVAIARAILKNPSIVLLDEATSSVDTETEQKIQEALQALCSGRTTFVVAHRLSTVMNADRIVVISDGRIVESGSHEELIQQEGKYATLWSKQIFTIPKDKTKSGDDASKITDLVNDLTPEAADGEAMKAKKASRTTPTANPADSGKSDTTLPEGNGSAANDKRGAGSPSEDDSGSETATEAIPPTDREAEQEPRLNPIATSFTPRSAKISTTFTPTAVAATSTDFPSQSYTDTSGQYATPPSATRQPVTAVLYQAGPKATTTNTISTAGNINMLASGVARSSSFSTADRSRSDQSQRSTDATELDGSSESFVPRKSQDGAEGLQGSLRGSTRHRGRYGRGRYARPHYNRRAQSKSEPTGDANGDN